MSPSLPVPLWPPRQIDKKPTHENSVIGILRSGLNLPDFILYEEQNSWPFMRYLSLTTK